MEEEIQPRAIRRILNDPRGATRPTLRNVGAMAEQLLAATATMGHFAAVTGIIHRAVVQSARIGGRVRFPPAPMDSLPGLGKTH